MKKVVVVGAGPVGALAALYAAERGDDVELYELRGGMSRFPFLKFSCHRLFLYELSDPVALSFDTSSRYQVPSWLLCLAWPTATAACMLITCSGFKGNMYTNMSRPPRPVRSTFELHKIHQPSLVRERH